MLNKVLKVIHLFSYIDRQVTYFPDYFKELLDSNFIIFDEEGVKDVVGVFVLEISVKVEDFNQQTTCIHVEENNI